MNKGVRRFLTACFLVVLVLFITVGLGLYARRQHDFALLNRVLKNKTNAPKSLLQIMSWDYPRNAKQPYGLSWSDAYKVKHLALVRLLELQKTKFGSVVDAPSDRCTGAENAFAGISGYTWSGHILVSGTPSLYADDFDSAEIPYWAMELFEFTREGRFVHRQCYTKDAEEKLLHALPSGAVQ